MTRRSDRKLDNFNLGTKLELRRMMLGPFAKDFPLRVMDCCAGSRKIWTALRAEFPVAQYLAMNRKRTRGGLRLDSVRWLREVGITASVVDIDTYGEPWDHFFAVCHSDCPQPEILVFLTIGMGMGVLGRVSRLSLAACGLKPEWQHLIPPASKELRAIILSSCLTRGCDHATIITEAWEGRPPGSNVIYIGLRMKREEARDEGSIREA